MHVDHAPERQLIADPGGYEVTLSGSFLDALSRYHMHDAVHWMATDPLDQTPDEWRRDVTRYAWVCQANGRHMPTDKEGQEHYIAVLQNVTTFDECVEFQERFTPRIV